MKHVSLPRQRSDRGRLLSVLAGGLAASVAVLATALVAQNNDNGGILPGHTGGGPSLSTESGHDSVLAMTGQLGGTEVSLTAPVLRIASSGDVAVGVAPGVAEEDAEFHSLGAVVAEQLQTGGLDVQASGTLNPEIGMALAMHAAGQSIARTAVLVGSTGSQSLQSVLSGETTPFAVIPLGDLSSLDLTVFHGLLTKHADTPFRASVVFISVDADGDKHVAGVSGLTGGGALDLAFE